MCQYENYIKRINRVTPFLNRKVAMSAAIVVVFLMTYLLLVPAWAQHAEALSYAETLSDATVLNTVETLGNAEALSNAEKLSDADVSCNVEKLSSQDVLIGSEASGLAMENRFGGEESVDGLAVGRSGDERADGLAVGRSGDERADGLAVGRSGDERVDGLAVDRSGDERADGLAVGRSDDKKAEVKSGSRTSSSKAFFGREGKLSKGFQLIKSGLRNWNQKLRAFFTSLIRGHFFSGHFSMMDGGLLSGDESDFSDSDDLSDVSDDLVDSDDLSDTDDELSLQDDDEEADSEDLEDGDESLNGISTLAEEDGLSLMADNSDHSNHPAISLTGQATLNKPVLYNIDATNTTMSGVSGVQYTLTNKANGKKTVITTGDSIDVVLADESGNDIEPGTYFIEQTAVPDGYVVTSQKKEFTIDSRGQGMPGIFYLYKSDNFAADKTGQVVDYINRIYQVDLQAKSGRYSYETSPINLMMVVDQSNSMLFPQKLTPVEGATVTLVKSGSGNGDRLNALVRQGLLNTNTLYYVVADDDGDTYDAATSTVYAVFYDGSGWCYQDAAWYSKAYRGRVLKETQNVLDTVDGKQAIPDFATSDSAYTTSTHGGSISQSLGDVFANNRELGRTETNSKVYQIYTGSEYNRLHELQQAVVALAGLVGSLNDESTMSLETFAKDVYSCQDFTLNNQGILDVLDAVNKIATVGGTNQEQALKHVYGDYKGEVSDQKNHLKGDGEDDYVILITDGAPNYGSIQGAKDAAATLKTSYFSGNDRLITVGLGGGAVGGDMLEKCASDPSSTYYRKVEEVNELKEYFLELFKNELLMNQKVVTSEADIKDVISDSFYITDKEGNALSAGDRISLNGDPDASGPGLVCYDSAKKEWYVKWDQQTLGTGSDGSEGTVVFTYTDRNNKQTVLDTGKAYYVNWTWSGGAYVLGDAEERSTSRDQLIFENGSWIYSWRNGGGSRSAMEYITQSREEATPASPAWKGRIYLKAKEDFIGGNSIDTNKSATVTLYNEDHSLSGNGISLPTPTVNVRLLEMEGFESEETVFLGDNVTDLREKIQTLLEKTVIEKIKNSTGSQMNYKEGATEDKGCYEDHFTIPYAIGELTEQQWNTLFGGDVVYIEYTYDDASSHGAVGFFSFSLQKTIAEGENPGYDDHQSSLAGMDVEKYTLTVVYTAYKIGDHEVAEHQRAVNVHNGSGSPGTEVGTGTDIPHGAGAESVEEIHHVHVVDGEIILTKVIDESLKSDQDQTYAFELYAKDPETGAPTGDVLQTVYVLVKAGQTEGSAVITPLSRNNYIVKEQDSPEYAVQEVEVIQGDTSCVYVSSSPTLEFAIGTNENSSGVNPDKNVILYNKDLPTYEKSVWVDESRYVYSKPFQKPETGGESGTHTETITVTTYDWPSGTIITADTSGTQYVRSDSTKAQLDAAHTNYGILTQVEDDNWTIEWHTWTSHEEQSTTPSGDTTYEPVTVTYYSDKSDSENFGSYLDGQYYYKDGSDYKLITNMAYSWGIIFTYYGDSNTHYVNPTTSQWISGNTTKLTYQYIYKKTTSGGSGSTTVWTESTSTVSADSSKIPSTTSEQTIEVPDSGSSTAVKKLSVGHGKITNSKANYKAEVPVQKVWSDTGTHESDTVYVVLYDSMGQPVLNEEGTAALMLKLNKANDWKGSFTVAAPSKDYNPVKDGGYQIREVKVLNTEQFDGSTQAVIVNDTADTNVYYVQTADENDEIIFSGASYNVHYVKASDNNLLIVRNNKAYELPGTGGLGKMGYILGGIGFFIATLVYGFRLRRRLGRRIG